MTVGWRASRYATLVGCALCFGVNAFHIARDYLRGDTVVVSEVQPRPGGIRLPSITFCNRDGFRCLLSRLCHSCKVQKSTPNQYCWRESSDGSS